jgi:hypothetical protein
MPHFVVKAADTSRSRPGVQERDIMKNPDRHPWQLHGTAGEFR